MARVSKRGFAVTGHQRLANVAGTCARQHNQPLNVDQPFATHFSAPAVTIGQPSLGQELAQGKIASLARDQQQNAIGFVTVFVVGQPDVAAGNRLDPSTTRSLIKLD